MATQTKDLRPRYQAEPDDPYHVTAEGILEPPTGWVDSLRHLGPGLILSASIVGSGELIATTALGAQAGFAILWMVIFSTLVKVAVQIELARWTISTAQPALTGYNKVPPKIGPIGWINILWVIMALSKVLQIGGIVGGVAVALSILLPIERPARRHLAHRVDGDRRDRQHRAPVLEPLQPDRARRRAPDRGLLVRHHPDRLRPALHAVRVQRAGRSQRPDLRHPRRCARGGARHVRHHRRRRRRDHLYTYWCVEKGYAQHIGPPDGSEEWVRRANGWISVMYKDAFVSWVIYTFGTIAFFLMGAAVLHPQGLVPEGNQLITTLSRMYTDTLGEWAAVLFLVGAVAVLGSTLWAAVPSWARMYTNLLSVIGVLDWQDALTRTRWIRGFTIALPIIWAIGHLEERDFWSDGGRGGGPGDDVPV